MVKCAICNGENFLEGARFCVQCGARLDPPQRASEPVPQAPTQEPVRPSVRITTQGNTTMAASSSYSYVSEREEPSSHGGRRPALAQDAHAAANGAETSKSRDASGGRSMAEALASVAQGAGAVPLTQRKPKQQRNQPRADSAADKPPMSESARRAFGKTLIAGSQDPSRPPASVGQPSESSTGATWSGAAETDRDLTWSPPADPNAPPAAVTIENRVPFIQSPLASTVDVEPGSPMPPGVYLPPSAQQAPVAPAPAEPETGGTAAKAGLEIVVEETSPAEAAEAESIARASEAPGEPTVAGANVAPGSEDSLLDDIDAGFERIVGRPSSDRPHELTEHETKEVKGLFTQIAAGHMRPVRDFVFELKLGEPSREWIEVVTPAISSLSKSAKKMGFDDLEIALLRFLEALQLASTEASAVVSGDARTIILEAYGALAAAMPEAFAVDEDRDRREPIIVQSLLKQVEDVRKVALDKLYAAGLTSLEMYYQAKAYDIAQAAGLPEELAERIVKRFAQYRREVAATAPDLERSQEHKKLAVLTARLSNQNEAFSSAAASWTADAARKKKRVRKERIETVLEVNVLLARLGEVELVKEIERVPFQGKVERLRAYLDAVKARAEQGAGSMG